MTEITQKYAEEATVALKELRETLESKTAHLAENQEKIKKCEAFLDKFDVEDQKRTLEFLTLKNKNIELEEKMIALEKIAANTGSNRSEKEKASDDVKHFWKFIRHGMNQSQQGVEKSGVTTEQYQKMQGIKYMRTDIDIQGGTWAPLDITNELLNLNAVEISPIRSIARSQMTSLGAVYIPTKTGHTTVNPVGEGATAAQSQIPTGSKEIKVNKNVAVVSYSLEMMQDSLFNIEQQITEDVREILAQQEGRQFVKGLGVGNNEAFGFLTNPGTGVGQSGVRVFETSASLTLSSDDILLLDGQLKAQYNPTYVFNRRVKSYIRTLKGTDGQYYWPNIFASGAPTTINAIPFVIANDMPDLKDEFGVVIAGNIPIALGDFYKGYRIVDHASLQVIRDYVTGGDEAIFKIRFYARVGGDVVVPESIVLLKVKA